MPAPASSKPIVLEIAGLGPVPSFKNNKMLTRGKLITDPKKQQWIKRCVQNFVSQLHSQLQTGDCVTSLECLRQSVIASVPLDDNWQELEIGGASCRLTNKEIEGAIIVIERIQP